MHREAAYHVFMWPPPIYMQYIMVYCFSNASAKMLYTIIIMHWFGIMMENLYFIIM